MVGEIPGHYQPDQENINPQFIITPEQKLLGRVFGEQQLLQIHPRRRQELIQTTQEVLDSLTDRERRVIKMRFGLEGTEKASHEKIGREFGVTRERIRQNEVNALRKLRHISRCRFLEKFVSVPPNSVASSLLDLNDEGFNLVEEDLEPLTGVPVDELGEAAPLVVYVHWQLKSEAKDVKDIFEADAKPFLEHLSEDQIVTLRKSLTQIYEKAQAGFYQKPEEPELSPQQTASEEAGQRLIYPNRLFPDIKIPLEELAAIGPRSIRELGLSMRAYNALVRGHRRREGGFERLPTTTIAELLSQTRDELLSTRNFGRGALDELEQRFHAYRQRSWGEGKTAEEMLKQAISQLKE